MSASDPATRQTHGFVAVIYKVGILRCVSVPEDVSATFAPARTVPVVVTVAGRTAHTTLVSAGHGSYRLFLDGAMRKAAGADAGDPVGIVMRLDRASREVTLPADFASALARVPASKNTWEAFTTALRREILRHIEKAKAPATRARRIARCVSRLAKGARRKDRRAR